jgi:hypothetical protein
MGAPVGNYLAQFNGALCLVRTESKRGNNKSECRQHEAEVLYQLHGSRLKELFSPSPDVRTYPPHAAADILLLLLRFFRRAPH